MITFIYLALTSASDIAYGLLPVTSMEEPKLLSNATAGLHNMLECGGTIIHIFHFSKIEKNSIRNRPPSFVGIHSVIFCVILLTNKQTIENITSLVVGNKIQEIKKKKKILKIKFQYQCKGNRLGE